jgi:hypothetical protein
MELDEFMVARLWNDTLQDDRMTWNDDQECMGLLIVDEAAEPGVSGAGSDGTVFETKLLGISYEPLDYVNPDGEISILIPLIVPPPPLRWHSVRIERFTSCKIF